MKLPAIPIRQLIGRIAFVSIAIPLGFWFGWSVGQNFAFGLGWNEPPYAWVGAVLVGIGGPILLLLGNTGGRDWFKKPIGSYLPAKYQPYWKQYVANPLIGIGIGAVAGTFGSIGGIVLVIWLTIGEDGPLPPDFMVPAAGVFVGAVASVIMFFVQRWRQFSTWCLMASAVVSVFIYTDL